MTYRRSWPPLMLAAVISLAGCSTPPERVPVASPCPALPQPPANLLAPPESPATRVELEKRLPRT
jgi:hypothetical protein